MGRKSITHMPGRTWITWNFFLSSLLLFRLSSSPSMKSLSTLHQSRCSACLKLLHVYIYEIIMKWRKIIAWFIKALLCVVCVGKDSRGRKLVAESFKLPTCAHHSIRIPLIDYHSLKLFRSPKTSDTEASSQPTRKASSSSSSVLLHFSPSYFQ